MTSLILKALRPIIVPLLVEAMEQHDRNRPELQHGVHLSLSKEDQERIKWRGFQFEGGSVRY